LNTLNWIRGAIMVLVLMCAVDVSPAREVAPSPPMGCNSWDSFGLTIDEADFKANVLELAKLHAYGWTYAVIDEGWYMGNRGGPGR
jgi:alpha-galactosidase